MISIDQTLLFQIIGFFALLIILNRFLYAPVLKILKEREDQIEGSFKKAAQTGKEVEEGLVAYDRKIKEAVIKGHEERNKLRQEAIGKEKALLEAARVSASGELSSIRKEIEASKTSALASLKEETKTIARQIADKVLDKKTASVLLALAFSTLIPSVGFAQEGEHGGGTGSTWKIINFVILAIGVYLVWTKAIKGLLDKRSSEIKSSIDEAKAAKALSDAKAAEYREKLNLLENRIAGIHNELKLEGEAEKQRIIAEAEKAAVKVQEQAKVAAEQEIKKARLEIRAEAGRLAVGLAEEILKKEISPADQERLVKGYLTNLRLN